MDEQTGPSDLQRRIVDYWNLRAPGYSLATRISLRSDRHIIETLSHMVNLDGRMRVADMGTSAGLMAIWLTHRGHDVIGLDLAERMIDLARRNAKELGLSIDFRVGDVQRPDLPKASFDMIVAKSIIWDVEDPIGTYERWIELLKPGGRLVVIDGNYYLDLFDEDYRKRKQYLDMKNGVDNNLHAKTNIGGVDLNIIRDIARELPLTRERRPSWDVSTLLGLGMTDIHVRSMDSYSYSVLTENGFMKLPSNFMICAQKPFDDMSPYEKSMLRRPVDDTMIGRLNETVRGSWSEEQTVLKAISDANRLMIVRALMSGSMSVSQIAKATGSSPSLVSHNLRTLRDAGVVDASKEGKEMRYSLTNSYAMGSIIDLCDILLRSRPAQGRRSASGKLWDEKTAVGGLRM